MLEEYSHLSEKKQNIIKTIYRELVEYVQGRVLELGPHDGIFTQWFIRSAQVEVVEKDPHMAQVLHDVYNTKIIIHQEDAHEYLRVTNQNYYNTVIIFGFLYHSHAPLDVLESTVNNLAPKHILLETWDLGIPILIKDEQENIRGNRFVDKKNCGLAITLDDYYYCKAMKNLGYKLVKKFYIKDFIDMCPDDIKYGGVYMAFEKESENE